MNAFTLWAVPFGFKWSMHALMLTCRIRTEGRPHVDSLAQRSQAWIFSAWHNNTACAIYCERNRKHVMMASASRDGELIARAIVALGNQPARGSSSRLGSQAARTMIRGLRAGHCAAVTPDGPRGPLYHLQSGALWIAAMSRCPLVPYHIEARRQWILPGWDGHKIPKPFTTVFVHIGAPYFVNREQLSENEEALRQEFQQQMLDNAEDCRKLAASR